jgi:hypothetical protein
VLDVADDEPAGDFRRHDHRRNQPPLAMKLLEKPDCFEKPDAMAGSLAAASARAATPSDP